MKKKKIKKTKIQKKILAEENEDGKQENVLQNKYI